MASYIKSGTMRKLLLEPVLCANRVITEEMNFILNKMDVLEDRLEVLRNNENSVWRKPINEESREVLLELGALGKIYRSMDKKANPSYYSYWGME